MKSVRTRWILLVLLIPHVMPGGILRVGPSRPFASLQQVTGSLNPGDTVLVDGDAVYQGGVVFSRAGTPLRRIVILGVPANNRRPVIDGGTNAVHFMTSGGSGGDSYTFDGFEVRNASFRGIFHQARDLVLRNLTVHHCPHGILGADNGSGSLLMEFCEVYACGSGTTYHQVYMATDESANPGSIFRMQFCWIHDAAGGNNVKSRAERNEIYYNWIEGAAYHELELIGPDPAGGYSPRLRREDSDVLGNVLWKRDTPSGGRRDFYVTRLGGDGTGESHGRYRFVNNTIAMGSSAVFRLFDSLESVEMHNNVFVQLEGTGAPIVRLVEARWTTGAPVIAGRNNWVQTGATQVPAQWTGTVSGLSPGFADVSTSNLGPAPTSILVNAGSPAPTSPPGFPFPSPAFPPLFVPPGRVSPLYAQSRPVDGFIDIGAFERGQPVAVGGAPWESRRELLLQNHPNPFNPSTTIPFRLEEKGRISLSVLDVLGRRIALLVEGEEEAGDHYARFDGAGCASGVYISRLELRGAILCRKMVLLR